MQKQNKKSLSNFVRLSCPFQFFIILSDMNVTSGTINKLKCATKKKAPRSPRSPFICRSPSGGESSSKTTKNSKVRLTESELYLRRYSSEWGASLVLCIYKPLRSCLLINSLTSLDLSPMLRFYFLFWAYERELDVCLSQSVRICWSWGGARGRRLGVFVCKQIQIKWGFEIFAYEVLLNGDILALCVALGDGRLQGWEGGVNLENFSKRSTIPTCRLLEDMTLFLCFVPVFLSFGFAS